VWALFCSKLGFARLRGFSGWRTVLWGFVSSRTVGEQPWECACWLFISPLLVRLACLRVSGVDSFSANLRRVDDNIDPSLLGFAVENPAMVVVRVQGAPQWQKHWASIRLPLNLALAGVQVPHSQSCI
jgi:hypothetical protein